jgi:hypothetical protein
LSGCFGSFRFVCVEKIQLSYSQVCPPPDLILN